MNYLNAQQMCVVLVLEAQSAQLELAANQLGGFLKLEAPAKALLAAKAALDDYKSNYMREAAGGLVIAPAGALPKVGG